MTNALLSSKVVARERSTTPRSVQGITTAVLAMQGVTEKGPIDTFALYTSFADWKKVHGGANSDSIDTYAAAQAFFDEGGQFLWFRRVVHYTDITSAATATSATATVEIDTSAPGPSAGTVLGTEAELFDLEPGDTLLVAVDGGAAATATFDAAAASVSSSNTEPFALVDGDSLTFDTQDGTQTITFDTAEFAAIGSATAAEVAAVINAEAFGIQATVSTGAVVITTDQRGTSASIDTFADVSGTPVAALGFTGASDTGTGDVADIDAVTAAEAVALIEADVAGVTATAESDSVRITSDTTGASSSVQVESGSTADDEFGFDNATHSGTAGAAVPTLTIDARSPGSWGDDLSVTVADATSGEAARFNLEVYEDGALVELHPNLTMDSADERYPPTFLAGGSGSERIDGVDETAGLGSALADRPANGSYSLTGGDDGLAGITDTDFVGSAVASPKTGLRGLDELPITPRPTMLSSPARRTSVVHNAMITYSEITTGGTMLCLLDPPDDQSATEIVTYVQSTALLEDLTTWGAMLWPQVKVVNPSPAILGSDATVTVPPSGHVAGMISRLHAASAEGKFKSPAGPDDGQLRTVVGVETDEVHDENKRDLVYPHNINIIDREGGAWNLDGSRTLAASDDFGHTGERMTMIFIEQSLKDFHEAFRHKNITRKLLTELERVAEQFLSNQLELDAYASRDADEAFFVDYGPGVNNETTRLAKTINGHYGIATNKPGEFIVLEFSEKALANEEAL